MGTEVLETTMQHERRRSICRACKNWGWHHTTGLVQAANEGAVVTASPFRGCIAHSYVVALSLASVCKPTDWYVMVIVLLRTRCQSI
jgi:hypothetical protein